MTPASRFSRPHEPPAPGQHGFALIAAIWMAGLIAAIAAGFAIAVRLNLLASAADMHGRQLERVADGLTRLAAFRLAAEPALVQAQDGKPAGCTWSDRLVAEVIIQDQAGLVDLNGAPLELLTRLAGGAGAEEKGTLPFKEGKETLLFWCHTTHCPTTE